MTQREEFEAKLKLVDSSLNQTRDYPYDVETDDYDDYLINNIYHGFKMGVEHAKTQAVPQWISVSERLPEEEGTYFCLGHNGTAFVCLFRATKYEGKIWLRSTGTKRIYGITHWMPLPAALEQNK